jgi:hypothetical protein
VRILWTTVIVGLMLAVVATPPAAPQTGEPEELIVRFEPTATPADRRDAREDADTDFQESLPVQGMQVVALEPGQSAEDAER